jgi:predicted DsbA family dithiol-disulfide isomerase
VGIVTHICAGCPEATAQLNLWGTGYNPDMRSFPPPVFPSTDQEARNYKSDKFELGSLTHIVLAHDYLCPWCWIGFLHSRRLTEEYGVTFDWRGFELVPPRMDYTPAPPKPVDPNEPPAPPKPPTRFDLFVQAEGFVMPSPRPAFTRTHNALLGAEWAFLELGPQGFDLYNEAIYRGFWEKREDIANVDVLARLAGDAGLDSSALVAAVTEQRYENNIVPYDDDAYAVGIRHVPTFLFNGEEKLAEAPYADLARATERFLVRAEKFKGKS